MLKGILLFPLRSLVALVGWFFYWMETIADWVVGTARKTEYVRQGNCNNCGSCCQCVGLELPRSFLRHEWLIKIFGLWHRLGLNFHPLERQGRFLLYRCGYYREATEKRAGHCGIYRFRHRICRFFPSPKLYGYPLLYESCGFSFVKRSVLNAEKKIKKKGGKPFKEVIGGLARR